MNRQYYRNLFLAVFVLIISSPTQATTYAIQSLKSLTSLSSDVVQAKVVDVESRLADDKTSIYTRVVISVTDQVVGERKSEQMVVYLPGGTVDGLTTVVVGTPQMSRDSEFVFMLAAVPQGIEGAVSDGLPAYNLVGLSQGLFDIEQDPESKESLAKSHVLNFLKIDSLREGDEGPPGGSDGMRLQELKEQIRKIYSSQEDTETNNRDIDDGEEVTKQKESEGDESEANPDHSEEGKADSNIVEDIGKADKEAEEGTGADSNENTNSIEKPQ